jgi:chromate transport protein ChrA
LAFFFKKVKGNAVFASALVTQSIILILYFLNEYELIGLPYLWLNFVGCFLAIIIAMLIDVKKLSKSNLWVLTLLISILAFFGYLIYKNSI